jgi:hypothetical protein
MIPRGQRSVVSRNQFAAVRDRAQAASPTNLAGVGTRDHLARLRRTHRDFC